MLPVCLVPLLAAGLAGTAGWLAGASRRGRKPQVGALSDEMARKLRELASTRDQAVRENAARQKLLDELARSEANLKALVERSPDAMFVQQNGTIRYVNSTLCVLLGYDRAEDLVGRSSIDTLVHPEDRESMREYRAYVDAQGGQPPPVQLRWVRRDGRTVLVVGQRTAVVFDGAPAHLVIARDVTQTRELEEQLRQSQKMDAIGRLAGGVAHDFNNLLGVVLNYSELALSSLDDAHPAVADLQEIAAAARRASVLTKQLLLFSRKQAPQTKIVALDSVVSDVERMLSRVIGADIRMTTELSACPGPIEADASQLEQVLLNLVVNARDAMPTGGNVTIETAQVELDAATARAAGITAGRYVMLAVRDTGCGMDAATASRAFEPFFTTKEVGKGTGLGLATVFGIVRQHGGGITIETAPGRGTTFRMYFPRVVRTVESLRPPTNETIPPGVETVLVVDDDERIRAVVRRILSERGYAVLEARNAHAALDLLQDHADEVRVCITDLVMPGIDGRSMAAQVMERYPHIRMLYMSGYTEHPAVKVALTRRDSFLQKPFAGHELLQAVRRVLDDETVAA